MYKNCFFFIGLLIMFVCAQTANDIGKITLSAVIQDGVQDLDASHKTMLETKIKQIVTGAGLAASGFDQSFLIYPNFTIYQTDVVEGGLQNMTKITAEVSFFIKQAANNVLFATVSKQFIGTGRTKADAIRNVISSIPARDKDFTSFLETGKQKIVQYYEQKCDDIISKADALVKRQEYEEAMILLLSIPEEVSVCYQKTIPKTVATFDAYQSKICAEQMQNAKTKFAAKNYKEVLNILSGINPGASCFADANSMILQTIDQQCAEQLQIAKARAGGNDHNGALKALESINPSGECYIEATVLLASISKKIAAAEKQAWDFKMQQYNDAKMIEQRDFEATQEARKAEQEVKMANRALASEGIQAAKEVVSGLLNRKKN